MSQMLPMMDPRENPVIEFVFDGELQTITGQPVVEITPGGQSMLDGQAQVVGTRVLQRIKRGAAAVGDHRISCEASDGTEYRVRAGILPVREA